MTGGIGCPRQQCRGVHRKGEGYEVKYKKIYEDGIRKRDGKHGEDLGLRT